MERQGLRPLTIPGVFDRLRERSASCVPFSDAFGLFGNTVQAETAFSGFGKKKPKRMEDIGMFRGPPARSRTPKQAPGTGAWAMRTGESTALPGCETSPSHDERALRQTTGSSRFPKKTKIFNKSCEDRDREEILEAMKIVFTGGGTAGHVIPNIALIRKLMDEGWEIHYIGSENGMERAMIEGIPGVRYYGIACGKLRRYFSLQNFVDPFRVLRGVGQAREIMKRIRPDVVFSKGGFVSVPVVMAAGRTHVVAHESDYTPGLANRIAERFADTVCVTFEDTARYIRHGKPVFTGTPIRPELYRGDRSRALRFTGLSGNKPVLLVMGGSSGAVRLNELLRGALSRLLPRFDVVHLCGRGKVDESSRQAGYVQFEYVDAEMADLFALADVVLSRAGANAVFEFLALAKPAVLVPLPLSASRGDQILNAQYFEKKGYARMVDQDTATSDSLAEAVEQLYENRKAYIAAMTADARLDGTDEVLSEIRRAAAGARA